VFKLGTEGPKTKIFWISCLQKAHFKIHKLVTGCRKYTQCAQKRFFKIYHCV